MSIKDLMKDHFRNQLDELEVNYRERGVKSHAYREILKNLDEDLFISLLAYPDALLGYSVRKLIPDWPDEKIRTESTSNIPFQLSVLEAALFWRQVRDFIPAVSACAVADYGAGWGRIARFAARDVSSLTAFEPNPVFVNLYRNTRVPGTLVQTDWESESSLCAHGQFDVIYCFSILTHASDELAKRINKRWMELTKSGSLIFATIRPSYFLFGSGGDAELLGPDRETLRSRYDLGELIYVPYRSESQNWGVTVMPESYIQRTFPEFKIEKYLPSITTPNQLTVCLRRR